jgi:hypothetical protein
MQKVPVETIRRPCSSVSDADLFSSLRAFSSLSTTMYYGVALCVF